MREKKPNTDLLVGMQYGSEAKGFVAQTLAHYYDWANRVGGTNAGHTVRWKEDGVEGPTGVGSSMMPDVKHKVVYTREFKARHIPATFLNPNCQLSLSAGALINWEVLSAEIAELHKLGIEIEHRLHIDPQACVVQSRHIHAEETKQDGEDLNQLIGSTREGIGAALAERVLRRGGVKLAAHEPYLAPFITYPVAELMRGARHVLLEGSQGTLLDNLHGYYPYCTSRSTIASAIAAESGVAPHAIRNVIGVVRTYPIRVAGNSGPTGGKEITWESLSDKLGRNISEQTTVTKRTRRVFEFSMKDFKQACILNQPNILALTFLNYLDKADEGVTEWDKLSKASLSFINDLEVTANAPVMIASTSADTVIVREGLDHYLE